MTIKKIQSPNFKVTDHFYHGQLIPWLILECHISKHVHIFIKSRKKSFKYLAQKWFR